MEKNSLRYCIKRDKAKIPRQSPGWFFAGEGLLWKRGRRIQPPHLTVAPFSSFCRLPCWGVHGRLSKMRQLLLISFAPRRIT